MLCVKSSTYCKFVSFVIAVGAAAGLVGNASAQGSPSEEQRIERFVTAQIEVCPVSGPLRVASIRSMERFVALAACRPNAVIGPLIDTDHVPIIPVIPEAESRDQADAAPHRDPAGQQTATATHFPSDGHSPATVRIVPARSEEPSDRLAAALRQLEAGVMPARPAGPAALAPRSYRTAYDDAIAEAAQRHGLDPLLVHAIIRQESGYNRAARSSAGAVGLMQIMPATGARFGLASAHLGDPVRNIETGTRLLSALHRRYGGNLDLMLAAYNAGEGAVARHGNRIPPYAETQNYVRRVRGYYTQLSAEHLPRGVEL